MVNRDVGLVRVMLGENGVRKTDGNKRLNRCLASDQSAFLQALPRSRRSATPSWSSTAGSRPG